jgi:hypothetical protein
MYLEFLAKLCSSRFASPHKTSNKTDKEKMHSNEISRMQNLEISIMAKLISENDT